MAVVLDAKLFHSPDRRQLVGVGTDGVWARDVAQKKSVPLEGHDREFVTALFHADGRRLITVSSDLVQIWDRNGFQRIGKFKVFGPTWAALHPKGPLVSQSRNSYVAVDAWNLDTRERIKSVQVSFEASLCTIRKDGIALACPQGWMQEFDVRLWDFRNLAKRPLVMVTLPGPQKAYVCDVLCTSDGTKLVVVYQTGTIDVWSWQAEWVTPPGTWWGKPKLFKYLDNRWRWLGKPERRTKVKFAHSAVMLPDEREIAVAGEGGLAVVSFDGKPPNVLSKGTQMNAVGVAVDETGALVAAAGYEGVGVWERATGKRVHFDKTPTAACALVDGKLVTVTEKGMIELGPIG